MGAWGQAFLIVVVGGLGLPQIDLTQRRKGADFKRLFVPGTRSRFGKDKSGHVPVLNRVISPHDP